MTKFGKELGVEIVCAQTNYEGEMLELVRCPLPVARLLGAEPLPALAADPEQIHYARCLGGVVMNREWRGPFPRLVTYPCPARLTSKQRRTFPSLSRAAGAFAHYSYALHDAIDACTSPVIEVHISNVCVRARLPVPSLLWKGQFTDTSMYLSMYLSLTVTRVKSSVIRVLPLAFPVDTLLVPASLGACAGSLPRRRGADSHSPSHPSRRTGMMYVLNRLPLLPSRAQN